MKTVLETPRLILRELVPGDLDFVAAMLAHAEVMRFYPKCYSREEAEGWLRRQQDRYARHGHGLWLVQDRATGEPVGQVGLCLQSVDGVEEPEVGYLIHRPFWRRGFATEAAAATRDYAFHRLGRPHVISLIRPDNVPSQGVACKLGMRLERTTTFHGRESLIFSVRRDGSAQAT
jgi:[ribosomal protein S5]-alanine N-acetyltransferase